MSKPLGEMARGECGMLLEVCLEGWDVGRVTDQGGVKRGNFVCWVCLACRMRETPAAATQEGEKRLGFSWREGEGKCWFDIKGGHGMDDYVGRFAGHGWARVGLCVVETVQEDRRSAGSVGRGGCGGETVWRGVLGGYDVWLVGEGLKPGLAGTKKVVGGWGRGGENNGESGDFIGWWSELYRPRPVILVGGDRDKRVWGVAWRWEEEDGVGWSGRRQESSGSVGGEGLVCWEDCGQ